jgi:CRISPR system Cascade subunit CasB
MNAGQRAEVAREWRREMQADGHRKGDKAALAQLRRASTAAEALGDARTIELCQRLGVSAGTRFPSAGRVAALAAVLCHVREEVPPGDRGVRPSMMNLVGPANTSDKARRAAKLKEVRFRALLAAREDDELLTVMRRLVALAADRANIRDLARAMLDWSDERRTRWTFDYYGALSVAPRNESPVSTEKAP